MSVEELITVDVEEEAELQRGHRREGAGAPVEQEQRRQEHRPEKAVPLRRLEAFQRLLSKVSRNQVQEKFNAAQIINNLSVPLSP